ncbi:signal peptidase I [Salinibacterium hongtaonis]|uniref:Signal peptidase I n=1 Tax=Homoserinimonas hongtaonis TaxID=2079791 RepID=A0A2U1SZJ0_9MICO|nr:signal peptidase I [Salinibacterium hongtaonis]PWB97029.1 signal peptidase I [Salinibacterium hongtaonis]
MSERRAARTESETKPRGLVYYIGVAVSAGLLALVLLVGVMVIVVPAATGSTPMTVLTGSMEPTYPPGTLVIVRPTDAQEIRIGDAITYQIESGKDAVVTHRVVSITQDTKGEVSFVTKGDANGAADALPVQPVQIKGKVWYAVPWIGYANNLLNGDLRGWLIPTIAVVLFLYAGYMLASGITSAVRKRRDASQAEADAQSVDDAERADESASDISHAR